MERFGRFKAANNSGVHVFQVFANGKGLLQAPLPRIDFASCQTDLLGFCYSLPLAQPLVIGANERYFVVANETSGQDALVEMVDPATASVMSHRISTTYMSYQRPGRGNIEGRAYLAAGQSSWTVIPEIDTAYGPVNWVFVDSQRHR